VTIQPGSDRATLTITALSDEEQEGDETVIVTLLARSGYVIATPASATVTILENPAQLGQTISVSSTISDYQAPYVIGSSTSRYTGMEINGFRIFNSPWAQTVSFTTSGDCRKIADTQIRCEAGTTDLLITQNFRGEVTTTENGFIHPISTGDRDGEDISDEITIELSYPAHFTYVSATVPPDEHNQNTLTWSRSNQAYLAVDVTFQTQQVQSISNIYLPLVRR
jgi:hypothetical protein